MMTDFNKYRNVSLKHETYSKLDRLSKTITPGEIISVEEAQDLNVKISESKDGWCHLYCDVKDSNTGKIEDLKELGFRDIEEDLEDEDNESE